MEDYEYPDGRYNVSARVIRYEDLAVEPYDRVRELAEFYGLNFHEDIKSFLNNRTQRNIGDAYSTYRNSIETPFRWKTNLTFQEVDEIQKSCSLAMEYWGYMKAINKTHQREFNPVANYTLEN